MSLIGRITSALAGRVEPIAGRDDLAAFMDARASFLSQKCIIEFCRVRAGVYWQKLFSEAEFKEELNRSTWRAYPQTFAMVAEMVEAALRKHAGLRRRKLPGVLAALAAEIFTKYPVPAGEDADFWQRAETLLRERLDETQGAAPRPVREMPKPGARAVFDLMPMHKDVITHDYDYIFNNLRMNLLRAHDDFVKAARPAEIVDDLLGRA
jgi:hypothetical protein